MGCAGSSTWEAPVTRRHEDLTLTLPTQSVRYGFGGAHLHPGLPQGVKPHRPTVQLTLSLPPPCFSFTCMSHTGTKCSPASGPMHLLLCLLRMLTPPVWSIDQMNLGVRPSLQIHEAAPQLIPHSGLTWEEPIGQDSDWGLPSGCCAPRVGGKS